MRFDDVNTIVQFGGSDKDTLFMVNAFLSELENSNLSYQQRRYRANQIKKVWCVKMATFINVDESAPMVERYSRKPTKTRNVYTAMVEPQRGERYYYVNEIISSDGEVILKPGITDDFKTRIATMAAQNKGDRVNNILLYRVPENVNSLGLERYVLAMIDIYYPEAIQGKSEYLATSAITTDEFNLWIEDYINKTREIREEMA